MALSNPFPRIILIGGFLATLALPLGATLAGVGRDAYSEKRAAVPRPLLEWATLRQFPAAFEDYFGKTLGLRAQLIRANSVVRVKYLHISPVDDVIIGAHGWLYYAAWGAADIRNFAGKIPYTDEELEKIRIGLEARRESFAASGARYLLAIAPDKQSIYPDDVPARFGPKSRVTRIDQLINYLRLRKSPVEIVDLRVALNARKHSEQVYYKTDSHWNAAGAFAAYEALAFELHSWFPSLPRRTRSDYTARLDARAGGDLAAMLSMAEDFAEVEVNLDPNFVAHAHLLPTANVNYHIWETDDHGLPSAVVLCDSFGGLLEPFLAESFSRTYFITTTQVGFNAALIAGEKPDVVIQESVERFLPGP